MLVELLPRRKFDAVHLGDEHDRKGAIEHRPVEVERIAERQHKPGNAARNPKFDEPLERARIGGLGRSGREGEHRRRAHMLRERPASPSNEKKGDHAEDEPQDDQRSEEHTSELQTLMRSSYAVFCWKKK